MNIGRTVVIFCNLDSDDYSTEEKAIAIYKVMNMPTHNGVSKKAFLNAIKWLWSQSYEITLDGSE